MELLRSADDPDPALVFDYDPAYVLVDMHERTEVAKIPLAELPTGVFTHFRLVLTHLDVDVMATLHQVPTIDTLTSKLNLVYALSDVEIDGATLDQGDAVFALSVGGQTFTSAQHWPPAYPSPLIERPPSNKLCAKCHGEWRAETLLSFSK